MATSHNSHVRFTANASPTITVATSHNNRVRLQPIRVQLSPWPLLTIIVSVYSQRVSNYHRGHFSQLSCMFTANASPTITVDTTFNVAVGQQSVLRVITFDQDGDDVIVTLDSVLPPGAIFVNNTYTWTPVNLEPANISYVHPYDSFKFGTAELSTNSL